MRVPGGRPVAILLGGIGFASCAFATIVSVIPPEDEPHKFIFALKILFSVAGLIGLGWLLFFLGRRRAIHRIAT